MMDQLLKRDAHHELSWGGKDPRQEMQNPFFYEKFASQMDKSLYE